MTATVNPLPKERTPVQGWQLTLARLMWGGVTLIVLGLFIRALPAFYNKTLFDIPTSLQQAISYLRVSNVFLVSYIVLLRSTVMLIFAGAAIIIFWHRTDDWMTIFVSLTLLLFGAANTDIIFAIDDLNPILHSAVNIVIPLGFSMFFIFLCIFPDGRFVPTWTRWVALIWIIWAFSWPFMPQLNPYAWQTGLRFLIFVAVFGVGVIAQFERSKCAIDATHQQQTRWAYFGFGFGFIGLLIYALSSFLGPLIEQYSMLAALYPIIGATIALPLITFVPVTITVSVLHYRLWDIEPLINRTLVYGTVTGFLGLIYFVTVVVSQQMFILLTGEQSNMIIIITTLLIAALFQPARSRLQSVIDRSFYREQLNFRQTFVDFSRELRTIIELPHLLEVLVTRITDLFHIVYGAVFLKDDDGRFCLAEGRNLSEDVNQQLAVAGYTLERLQSGKPVFLSKYDIFQLLIPLVMPKGGQSELIGILALGPRLSEQGYSVDDQALLKSLADQAGTAIYVAQLIGEKQEEAQRKEEARRRLEAYQNSPLGQAEALAKKLVAEPEITLEKLHILAQKAGQSREATSLLGNLPKVLQGLEAGPVAILAEGYNYLFSSRLNPEVLVVGLRKLTKYLEQPPVKTWPGASKATMIFWLSRKSLAANSVSEVSHLLSHLQQKHEYIEKMRDSDEPPAPYIIEGVWLNKVKGVLLELHTVAEAVHAYERVDTTQDKLAYLANAVDQLRRVGYIARVELMGVDQILIERITENWLAIITEAMSDLQTRAQFDVRLLTRHTWQGEVIALALNLRNTGRGAALNIQVKMIPTAQYTPLHDGEPIECLPAGEEAQITLRVRPHLEGEEEQFRARFAIHYADPRGPGQIENFADAVRLLNTAREYQFIPNPYVVGTPLQTGSPLFFGREGAVAAIQENLMAGHRNNLVLIGQRRTGKTSLLKQLPARLGDGYLPVYIDGQTLGLDPGLPNFFLTLATEIAFALEDQDYFIDLPELEDFAHSPANVFEHKFLLKVREAIGERHLLILLDEFEELEAAVQRGTLEPSVFGFLRHLIQHSDNLSVIFCGTHRLEELASDYWNILFNISLYRHIGFLDYADALHLIQKPVEAYGLRYDDLALDKMWRVTAGHPYFLQLLCHSLVNRHNRTKNNYLTVADVNTALEEILASGEAHFVYLWMEASTEERMVLVALSRMIPLTGQLTPVQIMDYLMERGIMIERQVVSQALHNLTLRDILEISNQGDGVLGDTYRWQLGLLSLWVEKYKSLSRVVNEGNGRANERISE